MSKDHPAASNSQAAIRTPDQLQQARRPDAPVRPETAGRQRELREAATRQAGILEQLETERAHD